MFVRNGEALGSVIGPKVDPEPSEDEGETPESEEPVEPEPPAEPTEELEPPARNGSREAWAAFLDSKGIEYDSDPDVDGRNDLIAKWDAYNDNSGSEL